MNVDFADDTRVTALKARMSAFMEDCVHPSEPVYATQRLEAADPHAVPAVLGDLQREARARGLWNLFMPHAAWGPGLTNLEYAPLAELTGRSPQIAPAAVNGNPPDSGNMEVLAEFGTLAQQDRWLRPLLDASIRSCFCMTEPAVASSDARNVATRIRPEHGGYVIDGEKWWATGALDPRCKVALVLGVSDSAAARDARHSIVLVPLDTPGVEVVRDLTVLGYDDQPGHGHMRFDGARVPREAVLGAPGRGLAIAQARLGPGRLHHCMRAIGMAERALELMLDRVTSRTAFGGPLAEQGALQGWIAEARIGIEQARLLVLKTAWLLDTAGAGAARREIAAIKVVAARLATSVLDRAIQAFGAAGLSGDFPLALLYSQARALRILDGPDEVHLRTVARHELRSRSAA